MEDPGRQLRRIREALRLKYRDVEEASQVIARIRQNQEFAIGLSRLADIENKGTLPSLYRTYSLCAIYGLKLETVLEWYGIQVDALITDASRLPIKQTRLVDFGTAESASAADGAVSDVDLSKTILLNARLRREWMGTSDTAAGNRSKQKHALIGTEDWFMFPVLPPGSMVEIDETKRRISKKTFDQEYDRPIYFLEHRGGYRCGWCSESKGLLVVQPHSNSGMSLEVYRYPGEIEILGQVIAVVKRLDLVTRRHTHS